MTHSFFWLCRLFTQDRPHPRKWLPGLLMAGLVVALGTATAATEPTTLDTLAAQRAEVEQATNLSEEGRKQALERIDETRSLLEEAARIKSAADDLASRVRLAPTRIAELRQDASAAQLQLDIASMSPWTLEQLEVVLNERQLILTEMQNTLIDKERELATYLATARTGGTELAELEKQLAALKPATSGENNVATADRLATVAQLWGSAREQLARARVNRAKLQQANLNQLTELTQLERDVAAARVEAMKAHVARLRSYLQERRRDAVEAASQAAQNAVDESPNAIRSLQVQTSALAKERERLVGSEIGFDRDNEQVSLLTAELRRDHERIRQIVELGGATSQVSALLQKRRSFVPSTKSLTQNSIRYQQLLSDAALRQLDLDEQLRGSRNIDDQVERLLSELDTGDMERDQLAPAARDAWTRYHETLLELWKVYTRYIGKLSTLEANTRQLLDVARSYRVFIDDHLLWMPSTDPVQADLTSQLLDALQWLVDLDNLATLGNDALEVTKQKALVVAGWLIGLAILMGLRRRAQLTLSATAAATQKIRSDSFKITLKAVGSTLALVLPSPWLFVGGGLILGSLDTAQEHTLVIAAALQSTGHTLLFLRTLRQINLVEGLARVHLGWQATLCDNLARQALWLIPLAAPLAFLGTAGSAAVPSAFVQLSGIIQGEQPGLLMLGRFALIALMLLLAIAIHRIWRRNGAVMQAMAQHSDRAKWASYHILWFTPAILAPLGIGLAALSGYIYTAVFITGKAAETLWFIIVLVLGKDMVLRALSVTQRRLRFEEALRYREEQLAQRAASGAPTTSEAEAGELPLDEQKINYGQLGDQVRQLVRIGFTIGLLSGLWWIWQDVIPAFSFLNNVELPITTSKLIDGVAKDVPLTLSDMVAGLLLGGLALFAARNIPALLELTILQRLPLSRASRYAFTTLTQYIVAVIGLVITFKALGLQWSSIQWLVAALSVGLGFGLQEIVANFISGIILLFEQPIRVGDIVTVDGTSGTVSRIRIRATTIVNWERQELIIPNKTFITGQLINWTLSDTINRVLITVGVDYDTDTRVAMQLMSEVAQEHPKVVNDPAPRITFESFGDNSLTLNLRAYLADIDARLATITELHQAILDKFRAAGISIAFPQRDVHLSTSEPLEMILRRGDGPARDPA